MDQLVQKYFHGNIDDLITHEFSLDNINEAIQIFRSGEAGRIVLNME